MVAALVLAGLPQSASAAKAVKSPAKKPVTEQPAAATPLVDEAIRNDPGIYPTPETMEKLYAFADLPANVQRTMTRSWTKIKSGR